MHKLIVYLVSCSSCLKCFVLSFSNIQALCKDLERAEVKKWLAQILEILMAERAKDQKAKEGALLDALIKIARKEGVPALYAGLLPNYLKLIPAAAISFLVYEQLKERMQLS